MRQTVGHAVSGVALDAAIEHARAALAALLSAAVADEGPDEASPLIAEARSSAARAARACSMAASRSAPPSAAWPAVSLTPVPLRRLAR